MIKIIVTGACGRMGKKIALIVAGQEDMELAGAVERKDHPALGKDMGEVLGRERTGVVLQDDLEKVIEGDYRFYLSGSNLRAFKACREIPEGYGYRDDRIRGGADIRT